ncbi:hypothetical protein Taro_007671 [Colocasia esculenta]|uniref:Uncharacterized protein n=1 Tax=Colocasia esculenta TaxID=4460 RepID=A0A843U110_COLES|nr:hypothetical protein [Colocasia esculenta]
MTNSALPPTRRDKLFPPPVFPPLCCDQPCHCLLPSPLPATIAIAPAYCSPSTPHLLAVDATPARRRRCACSPPPIPVSAHLPPSLSPNLPSALPVLLVFSILVGASAWVDLLIVRVVQLPASSDESVEELSLSKENEVEEVDPQEPEIHIDEYACILLPLEDMVRGRRVTSLGGRGESSGSRFTTFSTPPPLAGGPTTSAPLPPPAGPTTSTPLPSAAGPTTSAPLPLAAGRLTASASPSHMASGSTPPSCELVHADDEMSHHEGEGSYNETMRAVCKNKGYIIHYFCYLFVIVRNQRFTEHSDELRARSAWTTTARANFKHLMYNVRRNAERVCASTDKNQWKEHGPVWMRKEY